MRLDECMTTGKVPSWMTKGRTCLILKDKSKGNIVSNYRPITCLPLMWKLLTGIIAEEIYQHLQEKHLLPDEQKGCRRNSRGTKDQLMIDKMVLRNCKRRMTNLCIAWIDYKKAYDLVPHSWIRRCLKFFKISGKVRNPLEYAMPQWRVELTSGGERLADVQIKRGIFQGDSLSPILLVLALIPLSMLLNKAKEGYSLGKDRAKLNHLLFMDDLKLYGKDKNQLDSLVQTVRIFSSDIGMTFGIEKCAMVEMKRGKLIDSDGLDLPEGQKIKSLQDEEAYKYLGVLENDKIKSTEMKDILRQEYFRRVKKILRSKLNAGNIIQAINSRAVSLIRYGAGIIDWRRDELKDIDRKTRKLFTMHRSMHPQSDVDRLYWKRAEGGRGLKSVEEVVGLEKASIGYYLGQTEETLLKEVVRDGLFTESVEPKRKKQEIIKRRKANFDEKKLHSMFFKETKEVRDDKDSWLWLQKGVLKKETEGLILAAQEQALQVNWIKKMIDKQDCSTKCRMCDERDETVAHIVSECSQLAQNDYKKCRHDKIAAIIHWNYCKKFGFACTEKYYEHFVETKMKVLENDEVKLLWDFSIQTEKRIEHNKPDIVVLDKKQKSCLIIDVACPFDTRIKKKEQEKIEYYNDLKYEILKCWNKEVDKVMILPIVIGALGSVTNNVRKNLDKVDLHLGVDAIQRTCLLGTARILRKVLDTK